MLACLALAGCTGVERTEAPEPARPTQPARGEPVGAERESSGAAAVDMAYQLGRQLGEQTTRSAWQSLSRGGGCENLDKLGEVIGRSAGRILASAESRERPTLADYAEGYVHGMRTALADIAGSCSERCSLVCETARTAGIAVYCQLAKRSGAEFVPRRMEQAPQIPCAAGCDKLPAAVRPEDCS
jgi:hypothetical protein